MGGDYAPREVIKGALEAVSKCPCEVILVGDKEIIQLSRGGAKGSPY